MPEIAKNFSIGLTYVLEHQHVLQSKLAREIGISPQKITDYKKGRRRGDEIERNRIANRLGYPEGRIRQLGEMIANGVPGDDALEVVNEELSRTAHPDDAIQFNQALDIFFAQLKEFLRDKFGENLHVAVAFEEELTRRMPRFTAWKSELSLDILDAADEPALTEPASQYLTSPHAPPQSEQGA